MPIMHGKTLTKKGVTTELMSSFPNARGILMELMKVASKQMNKSNWRLGLGNEYR